MNMNTVIFFIILLASLVSNVFAADTIKSKCKWKSMSAAREYIYDTEGVDSVNLVEEKKSYLKDDLIYNKVDAYLAGYFINDKKYLVNSVYTIHDPKSCKVIEVQEWRPDTLH